MLRNGKEQVAVAQMAEKEERDAFGEALAGNLNPILTAMLRKRHVEVGAK